jgi:hypothetical protein
MAAVERNDTELLARARLRPASCDELRQEHEPHYLPELGVECTGIPLTDGVPPRADPPAHGEECTHDCEHDDRAAPPAWEGN